MKYTIRVFSSFTAATLFYLVTICLFPSNLWAQTAVTVQGIVELEGETDFGGVEVYFDPQSPSAVEKTITTNSDGTWTANSVNVGIYTVRFSKDGFVPARIPDIFIESDSVLTNQFMKVGGLKNISGSISGTLYSDTLYVVTDSLTVDAGNSLVIEGGTEVRFDPETGLTVNGGTLTINGTATDSVLFSSNADIPDFGDWKGIEIKGGSNHSVSHLTIDRALNAIWTNNISGSTFDFIRIQNTSLRQLPFRLYGNKNTVSNSNIDTKESYNIHVYGNGNRLVSNLFKNGFERSVSFSGKYESDEIGLEFKNNTVLNYTGTALRGSGKNVVIEQNTFTTKFRNEIVLRVGGDSTNIINNDVSITGGSRTDDDKLKTFFISNGNIINNRINIEYEGTERSYTHGHIIRSNGGEIRDNVLRVNTDRYLDYLGSLDVSNVLLENNDFQIIAGYLYGDRLKRMDVYLSDNINNSEVHNNTFHYETTNSSANQMGFSFIDSKVSDNTFSFLNSYRTNGVLVVDNSSFVNNKTTNTFSYSSSSNLAYKYAVRTTGSSVIKNNEIYNERGIYAEGLDRNGEISNNIIHNTNGDEKMGIHITGASEASVLNNTLISDATGTGILVENNSSINVQNNHVQNYATGITINSVNNIPTFNNLYQNSTPFSGSDLPSQIGIFSTTNHQGTSSDIYFNISADPQFVSPADSNYALKTSSPLVDAGSDKLIDADGTRSDIGAISFDYGNPKNLRVAKTGEASVKLSFDPVLRDSVAGYRIIGGTNAASLSEMSLITNPSASSVELTNLTNNESYYIIAKTVFKNTESIPTDTVTAIPGTASFSVASDSLIYIMSATDTSKTIAYKVTNTGTKDISVGGELSMAPNFENVYNSFSYSFGSSSSYYQYYLSESMYNEEILYMQVTGQIYDGSSYRWDAQNFIGNHYNGSYYEPELLINGQVVTALESGVTEDHTYTFILNKSELWDDNNQLRFEFNKNYSYSWMSGDLHFKLASMSFTSFEERNLTVGSSDTVSTEVSFGKAPIFMENTISAWEPNASDSMITHSTYLVQESAFGLSPTYFDKIDAGNDPVYIAFKSVKLDNQLIQTGDEIAIYSGAELVGSFSHNGMFPKVVKLNASNAGMPLTFQIYDNSSGQVVSVDAEEEAVASANSLTQINLSATLFATQNIRILPSKFNLMSLNVFPANGAAASVFGGISDLEIVQDDEGFVFIPNYNVNTIGQINGERGYYLFMSGEDTVDVQIEGRRKLPSETDVELYGNRFNIIPTLYSDSVLIEEAMGGLRDKVVIAQDDEGNVWMPSDNVNTIGEMIPGKGYLLYVAGNDTTYSFPDSLFAGAAKRKQRPAPTTEAEFFTDVEPSGLPYTVLISEVSDFEGWKQVSEIGLFTGPNSEQIVGSAKIVNHNLPLALTAWKENKDYKLSGFKPGDEIVLKGYVSHSDEVVEIELGNLLSDTHPIYDEGAYSKVLANLSVTTSNEMGDNKPREFELKQNYPNPFNPTTNIGYSVPNATHVTLEVFNVLGQKVVTLVNERQEVGNFTVKWDAGGASSGVYLIRMTAGSYVKTNKMMLIK